MNTQPIEIILRERPQTSVESRIESNNGEIVDYVGFPQTAGPYLIRLLRRPNETHVHLNDELVLSLPVERERQIVVRLHSDEFDDVHHE